MLAVPLNPAAEEAFIESVDSAVPNIHELVRFGIGLADVQDTFRYLACFCPESMPAHHIERYRNRFMKHAHHIERYRNRNMKQIA